MVDQATLNDGRAAAETRRAPSGGTDDILRQLFALMELQIGLFRLDLREGTKHLVMAVVLLLGAVGIGLASACVALMFIAELLVDAGGLYRSAAYAIAAILGFATTVGCAASIAVSVRASFRSFHRSREELGRTLEWFRETVQHANGAHRDSAARSEDHRP
jgi:hypothetical protein